MLGLILEILETLVEKDGVIQTLLLTKVGIMEENCPFLQYRVGTIIIFTLSRFQQLSPKTLESHSLVIPSREDSYNTEFLFPSPPLPNFFSLIIRSTLFYKKHVYKKQEAEIMLKLRNS